MKQNASFAYLQCVMPQNFVPESKFGKQSITLLGTLMQTDVMPIVAIVVFWNMMPKYW